MSFKKSFSCSPRIIKVNQPTKTTTKTKKRGIQFNNKGILEQYGFFQRGYSLSSFQNNKRNPSKGIRVIPKKLHGKYKDLNIFLFDRLNGNRDKVGGLKSIGIFIITHMDGNWKILLVKNNQKYSYIEGTSNETNNLICGVVILQQMTGLDDSNIKDFVFIKSFIELYHLIYLVYLPPQIVKNIIKDKKKGYHMYNYNDSKIDRKLSNENLASYKTNVVSFIDSFK